MHKIIKRILSGLGGWRMNSACMAVGIWGVWGLLTAMANPVTAGENSSTPAAYREGTWVSFRITAPAGQMEFLPLPANARETAGRESGFDCRFTVRRAGNGQMLLALTVMQAGTGTLDDILLPEFPLTKMLAAGNMTENTEITHGKNEDFRLPPAGAKTPSAPRTLKTVHLTLNGAGKKIEVWKSPEVPFGIVKILCEGFILELINFYWQKN